MAALICLLLLQIHVFASATGIDSLTPMPQDEAERVLANLNVKGYSDFPVQRPIECMAISEDGKIAVAFQIMGGYAVCLMDTDGVIISGFTFQNSGVVTLTWVDSSLVVFFVRGDYALVMSSGNDIQGLFDVSADGERLFPNTVEQEYQGKIYRLEKRGKIFSTNYSRLVCEDKAANKTVLYDSGIEDYFALLVIVWMAAIMIALIYQVSKKKTV